MSATAARQIRAAYDTYTGQNGTEWMPITALTERADLTLDQIHETLRQLARNDSLSLAPTSNQRALTDADRANAVWFGGQWKHVFCWG